MSTPATSISPDMARTVAMSTIKGGVGKTAVCAGIASEAARLGARVLVIDFDPNAAMTTSQFGIEVDDDDLTVGDVLITGTPGGIAEAILAAPGEWQPDHDLPWNRGGAMPGGGLAYVPCSPLLDAALTEISTKPAAEQRLATVMRDVARHFDLVLIDSGPRSDRLSWLMLMASRHVLCPTFPESQSLDGVERSIDLIHEFSDYQPNLRMLGAVITRYDSRKTDTHGTQVTQAHALTATHQVDGVKATEKPPFVPITHPAIDGVVPETTSGCVVFPEVIPEAAYTISAHNKRLPIHYGLLPKGSEAHEVDGLSFMRRQEIEKARQHTLRYTRLALRVLAATESPAMERIAQNLAEQPIPGLWDETSLTGDGTRFATEQASTQGSDDTTTTEGTTP